jgi:hypothetical protein
MAYKDYSYQEYVQLKLANNNFATEKDREVLEAGGLTMIAICGM